MLIIHDYTPTFYCIKPDTLVLRKFQINSKKLLIVNTNTLKTKIIKFTPNKTSCDTTTKYFKLLNYPSKFQDAGITSSNKITLTIDFCPSSKKGFDDKIFTFIIKKYKNPVPVTLFMTSLWAKHHKKEFLTLQKWQKEGKLDITWGNHTATHPYKRYLPLKKNFVLIKGYNLKQDTLDMEKFYIENNITPSIFFRFPGLISNQKTINQIKMLGLITIGSNTWLAKGEKIKNNSIILIHGNKNEERGVKIFLKDIKKIHTLSPLSSSI